MRKFHDGTHPLHFLGIFGILVVLPNLAVWGEILTVPKDYATIQAAMDEAHSGDTIQVQAGVYAGPVRLKSGVCLQGVTPGSVVLYSDTFGQAVLSAVDCEAGTIANLTLRHEDEAGASSDTQKKSTSPLLKLKHSAVQVRNCSMVNARQNGVEASDGDRSQLFNCTCLYNGGNGLVVQGAETQTQVSECTFNANGEHGVLNADGAILQLEDCEINANGTTGVLIEGEDTSAQLHHNRIYSNGLSGILVQDSASACVTDSHSMLNGQCGLGAQDEKTQVLFCNSISENNGIDGVVSAQGANTDTLHNTIRNNMRCGILYYEKCPGFILDNICTENMQGGIQMRGGKNCVQAKGNICHGNTLYGLAALENSGVDWDENRIGKNLGASSFTIHHLLKTNQFHEVEAIAAQLRKGKTKDYSGYPILSYFYDAIELSTIKSEEERKKGDGLQLLIAWLKACPDSMTAHYAMGRAYIRLAWEKRGDGWASTVTEEGWKGFRANMKKVGEWIGKAETLSTNNDPELYRTLILYSYARPRDKNNLVKELWDTYVADASSEEEETEQYFLKGLEIDPEYYPLYTTYLNSLLPRWGGSIEEVTQFIENLPGKLAEEKKEMFYSQLVRYLSSWYHQGEYEQKYSFPWKRVAAGFESLRREYPYAVHLQNAYCFMACLHQDKKIAAQLFPALEKYELDRDVWNLPEKYTAYKEWALEDRLFPIPMTPVFTAIWDKDMDKLRHELEKNPPLDIVCEFGYSPLTLAIDHLNLEATSLLLDAGANPDFCMYNGNCPIHKAAGWGKYNICKLLLEHKADPNLPDKTGIKPLDYAVGQSEHVNIVRLLLDYGADLNTTSLVNYNPVMSCVENDRLLILEMLLKHGARTTFQDDEGNSPLHVAAEHNFLQICVLLLEYQADTAVRNHKGQTPLHLAVAQKGSDAVVKQLLAAGANPNAMDNAGLTPLATATRAQNESVVSLLMEFNAKPHVTPPEKGEPLDEEAPSNSPAPKATNPLQNAMLTAV